MSKNSPTPPPTAPSTPAAPPAPTNNMVGTQQSANAGATGNREKIKQSLAKWRKEIAIYGGLIFGLLVVKLSYGSFWILFKPSFWADAAIAQEISSTTGIDSKIVGWVLLSILAVATYKAVQVLVFKKKFELGTGNSSVGLISNLALLGGFGFGMYFLWSNYQSAKQDAETYVKVSFTRITSSSAAVNAAPEVVQLLPHQVIQLQMPHNVSRSKAEHAGKSLIICPTVIYPRGYETTEIAWVDGSYDLSIKDGGVMQAIKATLDAEESKKMSVELAPRLGIVGDCPHVSTVRR